jgi:hypothetical protein
MENVMAALGSKVSKARTKKGSPPVILQAQADSHIVLKTPEELRQWEADVKKFYGISIDATNVHACETCSAGCSDDCGML